MTGERTWWRISWWWRHPITVFLVEWRGDELFALTTGRVVEMTVFGLAWRLLRHPLNARRRIPEARALL